MDLGESDPISQLRLPPGFRFYPTDEELLIQYLCRKIAGHQFALQIIADIDLYKFDAWDLPSKAIFGEKEWYFFSPRDRKYPNGSRPNRVAGSGYWKATGTDKIVTSEGRKVGIKKSLVFYVGKAPKGTKTNWIMHEYKLIESSSKSGGSRLDDWVLCRIYKKKSSNGQRPSFSDAQSKEYNHGSTSSSSHQYDDVMVYLPEIDNRFFSLPRMNSLKTFQEDQKLNLQNMGSGNFNRPALAGLNSVPELGQVQNGQTQGIMKSQKIMNGQNEVYAPAMQKQLGSVVDDEVQSGLRTPRVDNSGFFQQNVNGFSQSSTFTKSLDPFGIRFSTQPVGFGFKQ